MKKEEKGQAPVQIGGFQVTRCIGAETSKQIGTEAQRLHTSRILVQDRVGLWLVGKGRPLSLMLGWPLSTPEKTNWTLISQF